MTEPDEPVLLMIARTTFEAKVVTALLQGAGSQVFGATGNSMDEFAVSQTMMNLQGADFLVAPAQLEAARAVLVEAQAAGDLIDGDEEPQ